MTRLGREVLARTDQIVRGRVVSVTPVLHGAEVGRVEVLEVLGGRERSPDEPITVLSGAAGTIPVPGRQSLLLLSSREGSENFELVEVSPLDDEDGPARLAAFRSYLRLEAAPDMQTRLLELRRYLAQAVLSDDRWTRWNAAREYDALAADLPGSLLEEDRAPLARAFEAAKERALKDLLEHALSACPAPRSKASPAAPGPSSRSPAALAEFSKRYRTPGAPAAARRECVLEAALQLQGDAAPLCRSAMGDADPAVREAAIAAAGQFRMSGLGAEVAKTLANDPSPAVRRTAALAAGYLKASEAVASLALMAKDAGPASRDAAFALARIRDPASVTALQTLRDETRDPDRAQLLDFLLSDRFPEQERTLGETR